MVNTPLGNLAITLDPQGRCERLRWYSEPDTGTKEKKSGQRGAENEKQRATREQLTAQLQEYFAGTLRAFSVPINPAGTEFQRLVWQAVCDIGYGQYKSYSRLAEDIGRPRSVRAVANAVATNALPLLVPCHRVIRKNGTIGEYALRSVGAGGKEKKIYLLNLERTSPAAAHK